jgi:hypothetical protein
VRGFHGAIVPVKLVLYKRRAGVYSLRMTKKVTQVRHTLKLNPQTDKRIDDILKRMVPACSKQRYIEEAVIRRLSEDWKRV